MLIGRVNLLIQNIKRRYNYFLINNNLNFSTIVISITSIVIILFLMVNIVNVISVGLQNYKIIEEEQQKLNLIEKINVALKEELKFKQSDEFVMQKALQELNLAMQGSTIYNINNNSNDISYFEAAKEFEMKAAVKRDRLKEWIDLITK